MQQTQHITTNIRLKCTLSADRAQWRVRPPLSGRLHLWQTEECANYWHLKEISDSPFKNITVGTVINTTTTATPNTPRSTFAMETCPRWEVPKVEDPAPKLTPAGKREQAATNHCLLCVSEVRNQSSSEVQQLRASRRRRVHQSCENSGFAVLYYLSFKGGTVIVLRSKVRHDTECCSSCF